MAGNKGHINIKLEMDENGSVRILQNVGMAAEKTGRKSEKFFNRVDQAISKTNSSVKKLKSLLLKAGATIVAFKAGSDLVKTGANFESQMASVSAVMRASADEEKKLGEAALEMGQKTRWSASESAKALEYMGMAGYSSSQAIKALPGVLDLATAAGMDLGHASDIVTDSLTAMGLVVNQLAMFNDVLVGTSVRANTNISMLGETLKYSAPIASQLGYNIRQLSAMAGILANSGIKASDAGTDLRQAMVRNKDAAKELGTEQNDLIGTLEAAKKAGWGVNEVTEKYGLIASKSVLVLMNQLEEYKKLEKQLHKVSGETKKIAEIKLDTLTGDFEILKSTLESTKLGIFAEIKESTRSGVQALTALVKKAGPYLISFAANLELIASGLVTLGKIAVAGGVLYYVPAAFAAMQTAFLAAKIHLVKFLYIAKTSPGLSILNKQLWGTSASATAASSAMGALKVATGTLFAAYAGWKIGTYLNDNFKTAKLAGIAFVDGTIKGFLHLEYFAKLAWTGISTLWDKTIGSMKLVFAEFIETVGKGLSYIPFSYKITGSAAEYAASLRKSADTSLNSFADKKAFLKKSLDQKIANHKSIIDELIKDAVSKRKKAPAQNNVKKPVKPEVVPEVFKNPPKMETQKRRKYTEEPKLSNEFAAVIQKDITLMSELKAGAMNAFDAINSKSLSAAKIVENSLVKAFDGVGDAFASWITGARSFSDAFKNMAASVLEDLTRMIAKQMLISSLSSMFGGFGWGFEYSSGATTTYSSPITHTAMPNAKGGIFSGPGISAYSGQIVDTPTLFPFARGVGLMGEAGPEAIMPLERGADGKLGVRAENTGNVQQNININIVNESGERVEAEQTRPPYLSTDGIVCEIVLKAIKTNRYGLREAVRGVSR